MNPTIILTLAAIATAVDTNQQLQGVIADLGAHSAEYLSQVAAGNVPPAALLLLAQQVKTYTDKSYTTLFSQVNMAQVTAYVTGLPWYSSRLETLFQAAPAPSTAAASSAVETTVSSAPAVSSAKATAAASSTTPSVAIATGGANVLAPLAAVAVLLPALL